MSLLPVVLSIQWIENCDHRQVNFEDSTIQDIPRIQFYNAASPLELGTKIPLFRVDDNWADIVWRLWGNVIANLPDESIADT